MKVKTGELIGPALNYAVERLEIQRMRDLGEPVKAWWVEQKRTDPSPYSTSWLLAGPIIEREKIWWSNNGDATSDQDTWWCLTTRDPVTKTEQGLDEQVEGLGPTMLIAAMRCYVASKLGDVVDVPEELKGE